MDGEEGGTASCTGPALSPMRRSPEGRSRACPPQPEGPQTSPLDSALSRDHRDGSIQVSASEVRVGRGHVVTRQPSKWPERGCPFLPSWSICRRQGSGTPPWHPPALPSPLPAVVSRRLGFGTARRNFKAPDLADAQVGSQPAAQRVPSRQGPRASSGRRDGETVHVRCRLSRPGEMCP